MRVRVAGGRISNDQVSGGDTNTYEILRRPKGPGSHGPSTAEETYEGKACHLSTAISKWKDFHGRVR